MTAVHSLLLGVALLAIRVAAVVAYQLMDQAERKGQVEAIDRQLRGKMK